MHLVIYLIAFLLLSCSDKQDPAATVYARVGTNTLTNKNIELSQDPKMASNETVPFFIEDWVDQTVFLSAAKEGGLDKDMRLIKKRNDYYEQLLVSSFIENETAPKVHISNEDIRMYYDKNRDHFVYSEDGVFVEQYVVKSKKSAQELVLALKKNTTINNETINKTTSGHIKKGVFSKKTDMELFSKKKNVVGPLVWRGDILVLKVLNRYKNGNWKGLEEAYDEIYQRIFKTRILIERTALLDSLKKTMNIYINPRYQQK